MAQGHLIGGDVIDENNPLAVAVGSGDAAEGEVLEADGSGGTRFAGKDTSPVVIPAGDFTQAAGTPAESHLNRYPAWLLDQSSAEGVAGGTIIPDGWSTVDIDLWWSSGSVGTGAARFRLDTESAGDGEAMTTGGNAGTAQNFTTSGADQMNKETGVETAVTVTAGEFFKVDVIRDAGNAGDTLAGDAGVHAVVLRKAS